MERKTSISKQEQMCFQVASCIVPEQTATIKDGEGHEWKGTCKDNGDQTATTIVTKDGDVFAKVVYDYETSEEKIFSKYEVQ